MSQLPHHQFALANRGSSRKLMSWRWRVRGQVGERKREKEVEGSTRGRELEGGRREREVEGWGEEKIGPFLLLPGWFFLSSSHSCCSSQVLGSTLFSYVRLLRWEHRSERHPAFVGAGTFQHPLLDPFILSPFQ